MYTRWFPIFIIVLTLGLVSCSQEKSAEEYINSGQAHAARKDWKSAIIEFKNAVKQDAKNASARAYLGKAYLETYSSNAAIKELTRAIGLGYDKNELLVPLGVAYRQTGTFSKIIDEITIESGQTADTKARIYALRATALLQIKKDDEALSALKKAKQIDENDTEVRLAWAMYEQRMGNIDAQKSWIEPLLEKNGGVADAWSQMAQIESSAGNMESAEKAYSRAIDLRKTMHFDHARRALVRIEMAKYSEAQADIDSLKKAGANWPIVGHADGVIAFKEKKMDKAKEKFQEVLSRASDFAPSQYMLALVHFNNKNYQNASQLLERYVAVNPENRNAQLIYASSMLQANEVDKAMATLEKLKSSGNDDYRLLTLLGTGYMRKGEQEQAIQVLKKAVTLKPDLANARMQLGTSMIVNKSTRKQGQKELMTAIELDPNLVQAELILYRSYVLEKKFNDARKLAVEMDKKNSGDSQAANLIALTYLAEENIDQAVSQLKATLQRFPVDIATSHNLARIYLQQNELEKAKDLYEKVLEKNTSHLQTLTQLALVAAREKNTDQMMLRLKQAQERNPDELSARTTLASQYLKQNEANKAIQLLNDVKPEQKQITGYMLLMAMAKLAVNEQQHASRLLRALIDKNPEIPAAHFLMARSHSLDNNPVKMRESLENTIELAPDHFAAHIILARLDMLEGKVDAFKKRVTMLAKKYPDNMDVEFLKAKVASGDKNYEGAIETLASIMAQTPDSAVIIDLAKNRWQQGDRDGAISELQLWTQEHEEDTQAMMLLAQFYLSNDRNAEAIATYEKMDVQKGQDPASLNNLAWLLKDSNPEQGITYAKKALDLSPNNPFIEDTLAMLYLETGDKATALELSAKAAKKMPGSGDIQINYAKVLAANNQKERATDVLNKLYDLAQTDEARKRIKKELSQL